MGALLARAWRSTAGWHVGLLHLAWLIGGLPWILLVHGRRIEACHHGVPRIESLRRGQVRVREVVRHETGHIVHRFVYLPSSASVLCFLLRIID